MHWKLFADLAEVAGDREVDVDVEADAPTVDDALSALLDAYPALEPRVLTDAGKLEPHLNLLKNGEQIGEPGLSTPVDEGDELALFPPVSGG
ncbi:ubiquitin-like small modifier protein 1 [Halohasta salina]|uniref:ubiquitin-like small modifier protein 1 n=1 Tax=Halohasta salina TaxID=2961621 RepID=UPI0020A33165|nr:ubiquitin-like small modifier protein 1 [Halohasta salina]